MKLRNCSFTLLLIASMASLFSVRAAGVTVSNATYNGLFYETNLVWQQSSGFITLTTTARYKYTARLQLGTTRFFFSGQLDSTGKATKQILRRYESPLTVELQVDAQDPDLVEGFVSAADWTAAVIADRAVFNSRSNVSTDAGQYTMSIPGDFTSTSTPGGEGYGTITVTKAGGLRVAGVLADGTKFSQSAGVSKYGDWPFYAPLYQGGGSLYGWMQLNGATNDELSGWAVWIRPEMPWTWYYSAGFAIETAPYGRRYLRPPAGTRILNLSSARLEFNGGELDQGITNSITLDPRSRITNLSSNKLSLTFSLSNGLFSGRVMDPGTLEWIFFKGVVLQGYSEGVGFFPGWTQTGKVWLHGD